MSYPSVHSRPGTAERNLGPVTGALEPLILDLIGSSSTTTGASSSKPPHVLELASGPCTHITSWAEKWPEIEWWGSVRDTQQLKEVKEGLREGGPENLHVPIQLDIQVQGHWKSLEQMVKSQNIQFSGVIMLNLIHCMPLEAPEGIFQHLTIPSYGRSLLVQGAWVAAYGPWLNDDGSYKSQADKDFESSHVKATDASLGLRSIASVTSMAEKYGFTEERRVGMPAGNLFVIWRKRIGT